MLLRFAHDRVEVSLMDETVVDELPLMPVKSITTSFDVVVESVTELVVVLENA